MRPFENPIVAHLFEGYSPAMRCKLLALRDLIFKTAASIEGVGKIEETLKWGEPAYVTSQSKSGSTVRIDCKKGCPSQYAIYFHCQTNLVETFRTLFPGEFKFEGNRAIVFDESDTVPEDALAFCIAAALTYHRNKPSSRPIGSIARGLTRAHAATLAGTRNPGATAKLICHLSTGVCKMLAASCHCGAVRIEVPRRPRSLTNCNCSICRRYGTLWAYYKATEVHVSAAPGATREYVWGDKHLRFVRCGTCGCITHWERIRPTENSRMGVNARNFEPSEIGAVRIRLLDGASTWKYVD